MDHPKDCPFVWSEAPRVLIYQSEIALIMLVIPVHKSS